MSTNPSFVFSYLPATPKNTIVPPTAASPSLYEQTTAFLLSARKAFTTPKLTAEQDQIAILQQTRQHLERHAEFKAKVGMGVDAAEMEQRKIVGKALAEIEGAKH